MMGASLKGCDTIQKPSLRKVSIGGSTNPIGKKVGSKMNISIRVVQHQKLRQILVLQTQQFFSGSVNTESLVAAFPKLAKSRNGAPQREIRILCMVERDQKIRVGKGDALPNGNHSIHLLNGYPSYRKYGKKIITNVKGVASHPTGCIFITSDHSLIKNTGQIWEILFSSVKNVIILFTVKRTLTGRF